ncbi:glycoside hydrolase family 32 protein [Parabacteroides provencensis]|uniref:glycoside hydrolase family 32 protein n=1 Tax=Parabacteroides provencensis TaxID=1944636 RepID=UPI000C160FCB|nr:glycoside hydrolase family 32 protein [Parabacteroides provencensis]
MKGLLHCALAAVIGFTACTGNKTNKNTETAEVTSLFQEKYRPQIHFSPAEHWMNDPNGMVYYEGEYHLFYQHYPEKSVWGPMHWGHAVSKDLVHWEHLPIALYPDSLGYIFSGSAVVDWNNTSGFGTKENPPLVAFFTYHNPDIEQAKEIEVESQAIAYSTDKGRTWTKYDKNPVIKNPGIRDFRDPKVIWHEASKRWIVALASGQEIRFYSSPDCKDWTYLSNFGKGYGCHDGVWECPDLIPLKVKGSDETKWVLIVNINPGGPAGGSATQYFVGDFDGKTFTSDQKKTFWMDHGRDNYAGVTWSDAPDGRQILIGWMNNWQYAGDKPCVKWSGAATLPRELGLVKDGPVYLLTSEPVKEISTLYGESVDLKDINVSKSEVLSDKFDFAKAPVELKLTFNQENNTRLGFASRYGVRLKNGKGEYITIGYENVDKLFYVDRTNAVGEVFSDKFASIHSTPYIVNTPTVEWTLLIDVASVEFFTAEGRIAITDVFYPSEPFDTIEVFTENGDIQITEAKITELHSIWK